MKVRNFSFAGQCAIAARWPAIWRSRLPMMALLGSLLCVAVALIADHQSFDTRSLEEPEHYLRRVLVFAYSSVLAPLLYVALVVRTAEPISSRQHLRRLAVCCAAAVFPFMLAPALIVRYSASRLADVLPASEVAEGKRLLSEGGRFVCFRVSRDSVTLIGAVARFRQPQPKINPSDSLRFAALVSQFGFRADYSMVEDFRCPTNRDSSTSNAVALSVGVVRETSGQYNTPASIERRLHVLDLAQQYDGGGLLSLLGIGRISSTHEVAAVSMFMGLVIAVLVSAPIRHWFSSKLPKLSISSMSSLSRPVEWLRAADNAFIVRWPRLWSAQMHRSILDICGLAIGLHFLFRNLRLIRLDFTALLLMGMVGVAPMLMMRRQRYGRTFSAPRWDWMCFAVQVGVITLATFIAVFFADGVTDTADVFAFMLLGVYIATALQLARQLSVLAAVSGFWIALVIVGLEIALSDNIWYEFVAALVVFLAAQLIFRWKAASNVRAVRAAILTSFIVAVSVQGAVVFVELNDWGARDSTSMLGGALGSIVSLALALRLTRNRRLDLAYELRSSS